MQSSFDAQALEKTALFSSLPAEWADDLMPDIQAQIRATKQKVVVLDDDPTGTRRFIPAVKS